MTFYIISSFCCPVKDETQGLSSPQKGMITDGSLVVTSFVIGILGMISVIPMPSAAFYTLFAFSGLIITADAIYFIVSVCIKKPPLLSSDGRGSISSVSEKKQSLFKPPELQQTKNDSNLQVQPPPTKQEDQKQGISEKAKEKIEKSEHSENTIPTKNSPSKDKLERLDGLEVHTQKYTFDNRDIQLHDKLCEHSKDPSKKSLDDLRISWEEIAEAITKTPEELIYYFPIDVTRFNKTKKILRLLEPSALKHLLRVFSGTHFRMLSDAQFKSKDFPGEILADVIKKNPSKLDEFFPRNVVGTRVTLRLFRENVRKQLEPVLSKEHLAMLSM